jgi:hypothetical protein
MRCIAVKSAHAGMSMYAEKIKLPLSSCSGNSVLNNEEVRSINAAHTICAANPPKRLKDGAISFVIANEDSAYMIINTIIGVFGNIRAKANVRMHTAEISPDTL